MTTPAWHALGTLRPPRTRRYRGALVEPNTIQIGHLLLKAGKPRWYPGPREAWDADVAAICRREALSWKQRVVDLGTSYGIKIDSEPNEADGWHRLALALARSHVPGFKQGRLDDHGAKNVGRRRISIGAGSTFTFAIMVWVAMREEKYSTHAIAKYVTDQGAIKSWKAMIGKREWTDVGERIRRKLPFETAKYYVPQLCSAWRDVKRGKATPFQYQAVPNRSRRAGRCHPGGGSGAKCSG